MAKEIELKLALSPYHVASLLQHPLFKEPHVENQGTQTLSNCYYDTSDFKLQQSKVALRIRKTPYHHIQTLKTKGIATGGLHQRREWEWQIPSDQLDFHLLKSTCWPELFEQPVTAPQLTPIFNTDFERQLWYYRSSSDSGEPIEIEIALDRGEIWTEVDGNRRTDPLCELELELKKGPAQELFNLALQLARQIPLFISDISKAERGFRLFSPENYDVHLTRPTFSVDQTLEEVFIQLLEFELQYWPRQIEAWQFNKKWEHVAQALESLRNIRAILEHFIDVVPIATDSELHQIVERFTDRLRAQLSWRRCNKLIGVASTTWTRNAAEHSQNRIEVMHQTIEAGLLGLLLGQMLSTKNWQTLQSEAHRQRGQTLLADA